MFADVVCVIGCDSLGKNHFVMLLHFNKYFYFLPHSVTVSLLCITAATRFGIFYRPSPSL
jgi:hypothetical protein